MGFVEAFIGTTQSKISGVAVLLAIIVLFFSLIFSNDGINKVGMAFIVLLICIPIVLYSLFQLTCLVTGSGETWWCGVYAWILTVFTVIFAAFIIVATIYLMVSKKPNTEDFRSSGRASSRRSSPPREPLVTVPKKDEKKKQ